MKTLSILILFTLGSFLSADTLYLSNNNVVKGRILELTDSAIKIETIDGILEVERDRLVRGEFFGEGNELSGELVFEFLLDGKIKDSSGSGYPVVTKSIPYVDGVLNDEKGALESSGSGQYFYIEDSSTISDVENFTIALNFYPVDTSENKFLISNWENTFQDKTAEGRFSLSVKDKTLVFYVVDSSGYYQALVVKDTLKMKEWNTLAISFNSGEMSLYVNGETVGTNVISSEKLLKGSWPLYFMTAKYGTDFNKYNIVGKIDNIRMYNAFLSDSEINLLYKIENM